MRHPVFLLGQTDWHTFLHSIPTGRIKKKKHKRVRVISVILLDKNHSMLLSHWHWGLWRSPDHILIALIWFAWWHKCLRDKQVCSVASCWGSDTCMAAQRQCTAEGWGRRHNFVLTQNSAHGGEQHKRDTEEYTCLVAVWTNIQTFQRQDLCSAFGQQQAYIFLWEALSFSPFVFSH